MSVETDDDRAPESEAIVEPLKRWYHVPALVAVLAYMLWSRTLAFDRYVRDGQVYFGGNDAYYHYRATAYSVDNWPRRLFGDPWTQFPFGGNAGHFGTLMDQVVGTVALIVGLGDPSARQIAIIVVLAPVLFGMLCAIPTYYLAKQLSESRVGGVTAAVLLAIVPQSAWVLRSSVGFYDHHVAETLGMTLSVLAMVWAITVVRRERPVFEQVQDHDWAGLRPSVKASGIAGLAIGAYLLTWPSGVVLVGIFGVFFVIATSLAVVRGESPEHLAFLGVIANLVPIVVILPWIRILGTRTTTLSLLQVAMLLGVAVGCAFLGALARYWDRERLDPSGYPAAVGAIGAVAVGAFWLVLPDAAAMVWHNMQRILLLSQTDTALTISEAQSMFGDDRAPVAEQFYDGYGFAFYSALLAGLWMAARAVLARRSRSEYLLVAVWTVFLVLMAMTQVRFHYYLVVPVAVLNGWLVVQVLDLVEFSSLSALEDVRAYHVLAVLAIVMVLVVPIASPLATGTVTDRTEDSQPGDITVWQENLEWLAEETPEPGTYGGADDAMDYYGPFDQIDDYDYPEGAYGVMSWWDYGHWITVEGERIPNANPFQAGATDASAYFQAPNESRANAYLDALPADPDESLGEMNESELQEAIESRTDQEVSEETRYVMIDDQMAGGKFGAITQWSGPDYGQYFDQQQYQIAGGNSTLPVTNQRFRDTMLSRLYMQDASQLSDYRLVDESSSYSIVGGYVDSGGARPQTSLRIRGDWEERANNISRSLRRSNLFGQPLQIGQGTYVYDAHVESSVKTFERVDGATITGEGEPGTTAQAQVSMAADSGRTFTYAQTEAVGSDGTFELTVPYATTNELGPEDGRTNASVVADGEYTVRTLNGTQPETRAQNVSVPEPAIYDGEEIAVELEEVPEEDQSGGNESDGTGADGNESVGNGSDDSDGAASGSASSVATASGAAAAGGPNAAGSSGTGAGGSAAALVTGALAVAPVRSIGDRSVAGE